MNVKYYKDRIISDEQTAIEKLTLLLEQGQFELVSDTPKDGNIKLVYLMNDAVESFIVFEKARVTGSYQKDFEDWVEYSLSSENGEYVLVIYQQDIVFSILFKQIYLETHLYNYGCTGHFWIKKDENIRQLEYKIAIMHDKKEYLGKEFCNEKEIKLSELVYFPPLNYTCYPSVPKKYLVPRKEPWKPSMQAIDLMIEYAKNDNSLKRNLKLYKRFQSKAMTRHIAHMLHHNRHSDVIETLMEEMILISKDYSRRKFDDPQQIELDSLLKKAKKIQKRYQSNRVRAYIYVEEPFIEVNDSIKLKVYVLIIKKGLINQKVIVKKVEK